MSTARLHHFVSQCYLRGFVADRKHPKLFVADASTRKTFTTSPANIAAERDFHRVESGDHPPDVFENALSKFEGELDQALRRITAARSIQNAGNLSYVLNLVAMLAVKNPRLRGNFGDVFEQITKRMLLMATETRERWEGQIAQVKASGKLDPHADSDYEKAREFVERDAFTVKPTTTFHLDVELKAAEAVLPFIFARKWMLFRAPPGSTGFITSDHPVCLMWSDPNDRVTLAPPGLGLKLTQLVFPISNELAMIGAFEIDDMETDADEEQIAHINGSIILHSTKQIYARDENFPFLLEHHDEVQYGRTIMTDRCMTGRPAQDEEETSAP